MKTYMFSSLIRRMKGASSGAMIAALALAASSAFADSTAPQSFSVSGKDGWGGDLATGDGTGVLTIQPFNNSLGTLLSVTFGMTDTLGGTPNINVTLTNRDTTARAFTANIQSTLDLLTPAPVFATVLHLGEMKALAGTIPAPTPPDLFGSIVLLGTDITTFSSTSITSSSAADLALYSGPNPITLLLFGGGFAGDSLSGNAGSRYDLDSKGDVTVVYNYLPNSNLPKCTNYCVSAAPLLNGAFSHAVKPA